MELLTFAFLKIIATSLIVCALLTAFTYLASLMVGVSYRYRWYIFVAVFAFSMLGFVAGDIMSNSREPSVSAVLPAALTLMGGVAAFQIGSKGVEDQAAVCALILVFSLGLYTGSFYGSEVRGDNTLSADRDIKLEKSHYLVDLQRLDDYVNLQKRKREYESEDQVDLSRFESGLERSNRSPDLERTVPAQKPS